MKTKIIIAFSVMMGTLLSCSEGFFDKYPTDSLTEGSFYGNVNDMEYGVNDAYRSLKTAYGSYLNIGDLASDNAFNSKFNNNADNISINESNVTSDNSTMSSLWTGHYQVISRANIVLDKMALQNFPADVVDRYTGECLFLRGLMYFNLVRIFGDVPLVLKDITTTEEAFSYGRKPSSEVYAQIIEDLESAIDLLPNSYDDDADVGRATSLAGRALLGKVYLTLARYQDAYDVLLPITTAGVHALLPNYFDVFDAQNPNNQEIIFAIQYARGYTPSLANGLQSSHYPNEQIGTRYLPYLPSGGGALLMTTSLYRAFDVNDERLCYVDSAMSINWERMLYFSTKYIDRGQTVKADSGSDIMILRYADVLLMLAEAKAQLNQPTQALPFLQEVRSRANLTTDDSVDDSKEAMLQAIEDERRIEFFSEGHRWFDMLRFGNLQDIMDDHFADGSMYPAEETGFNIDAPTTFSTVSDYELLFPIPNAQVVLNPDVLQQNPGY